MIQSWYDGWTGLLAGVAARLEDERGWATVVALLLLVLIAWVAAQVQKRRQVAAMLTALDDTTHGRCVPHVRSGAWGFAVAVEPAPEPFRSLRVSYRALSYLDIADWGALIRKRDRSLLQFAAMLVEPLRAELLWAKGRPPLTVLGARPGPGPWVLQRLDITHTEYALRGANTGALRHAFGDLHARTYAILELVTVQRERAPEVRLVVAGRLDPRSLSPLLTSLRAIGRAALRD